MHFLELRIQAFIESTKLPQLLISDRKLKTMENSVVHPPTQRPRYGLVSGANKGIGFEICRQLAGKGIVVILGSRDEKRGIEAQQRLKEEFFDDRVLFHQLDVVDPASVAAVAHFIKTKFGKLDILVNNAGILGAYVDGDASLLLEYLEAEVESFSAGGQLTKAFHPKANGRLMETLEGAEECIETNYYAVKTITQAFIPLLQQSDSPTIVNVSSSVGSLVLLPEWSREVLSREEGLTEESVDQVVQQFLNNFKEGSWEQKQWPPHFAAYKVSKAALNAYTRLTAKQHPNFHVNAVCPGYARTDINCNSGELSAVEGAEVPVKLALLPRGGPSGSFFSRTEALAL